MERGLSDEEWMLSNEEWRYGVITCLNKNMKQLKLFMITVHSGKLVKIIVASEASQRCYPSESI